jgi:cell division protein FtsB
VRVKVDLGLWSKLTQAVIALVVMAVLVLIALAYKEPIQQNERLRREIDRLTQEQKKQEAIEHQLRAEIDALRNDPQTVTRLVREKLGYAKTNETVIRFEPASGNHQPERR